MPESPKPYEIPEGMILTTLGEARRLHLNARYTHLAAGEHTMSAIAMSGHGSLAVLADPPEPVMVSIDVEHLVNVRKAFTSDAVNIQQEVIPGRKAALLAIDAIIAGAES